MSASGLSSAHADNEGINDDLNKAIWAILYLEPQLSVEAAVAQYARLHFGSEHEAQMTRVLLGLEANWVEGDSSAAGSGSGGGTAETLALITDVVAKAGPRALLTNWRLAMYAFRATLDAYTQQRFMYETAQEQQAMQTLAAATGSTGLPAAIATAREQLQHKDSSTSLTSLRAQVSSLASALNESAGLLVKKDSAAASTGAMMVQHQNPELGRMSWETPLSSAPFLDRELQRLHALTNATEQIEGVLELLSWQDAGGGGYYDNLGVAGEQPHLLQGQGFAIDPSFYNTSYTQFAVPGHGGFNASKTPLRQSWNTAAEVMFDGAVQLRYENLDPGVAAWEVSVTWMAYMAEASFGGGQPDVCHRRVGCTAEGHVVHQLVEKPFPMRVSTRILCPLVVCLVIVIACCSCLSHLGGRG